MKKMFNWIPIVPACVLMAILAGPSIQAPNRDGITQDPDQLRFGQLVNKFGFAFLDKLGDSKNNVIFSPFSLVTSLNLLYPGIDKQSESAKQFSDVIGYKEFDFSRDEDHIHQVSSSVLKSLMESVENNAHLRYHRDLNISISNLVLSNQNTGNLSENFQGSAEKYYQAKLVEFKKEENSNLTKFAEYDIITQPNPVLLKLSSGDQLANAVDLWTKDHTGGRLDKILDPKSLDLTTTSVILVNAIYFKAAWLHTFSEYLTGDGHFLNDGNPEMKVKVQFMKKRSGKFGYYDSVEKAKDKDSGDSEIDFRAIEIPFKSSNGQDFSMVVMLPKKTNELHKLERWLTWQNLQKIYAALSEETVNVGMPKFRFKQKYNAIDTIERMGINLIFEPNIRSGLSKLFKSRDSNKKQFVNQFIHKAMIDVDEFGAEAAAVSSIEAVTLSLPRVTKKPKDFHADHPFLIIIRHIKTNTPLFMGRVNKL